MKTQTATSKTSQNDLKTVNAQQHKIFSSVDLWNIQRQRKSTIVR